MTKTLSTIAGTIILSIGITFYSHAQIAKVHADSIEPESGLRLRKLYNNEVNSRAMRDFMKQYKDVSNEKWNVTDIGVSVNFAIGEIKYSVRYDKKGNRLFTIRSYSEKYLLRNVRTLVRSTYFDYNIKWVEEVEKPFNPKVYLVLLEGETEWIKVRVGDGELSVYEKIDK